MTSRQLWKLPIRHYHKMKHFFIITNALKDEEMRLTRSIISYIEGKGGSASYAVSVDEHGSHTAKSLEIPDRTECIIVIGGDGTLIRAARDIVAFGIPLVGVNMGKLGYLCELEEHTVENAIDELFAEHYLLEERMMLSGYALKGQERTREITALNDIVIHRSGALQIVNLNVYVNGEYLYSFKADGIILATPTGSTGYSMSAGGPIVDPKAKMLLMTPINAHTLNSKSIVISPEDEVEVEIGCRRSEKDEQVEVSFDGDNHIRLEVGDRIIVHKAQVSVRVLKISKISFLEILRKKMQTYT